MNGMKGIVHEWIYPIIIFVVMTSQTFSGDVYILPGYDLDEDGFGEFILINQESNPAVRYIELTKKLNHVELWSKSLNELPFELNHIELISGADSATSFLYCSAILSDQFLKSFLITLILFTPEKYPKIPYFSSPAASFYLKKRCFWGFQILCLHFIFNQVSIIDVNSDLNLVNWDSTNVNWNRAM